MMGVYFSFMTQNIDLKDIWEQFLGTSLGMNLSLASHL